MGATPASDAGLITYVNTRAVNFSDHRAVFCRLNSSWTASTTVRYQFHDLRGFDRRAFIDNIATLLTPTMCVDGYVDLFQHETLRLVDKHAPLQTRCRRVGSNERTVDGCPSRRVLQSATADVLSDGIDVLVTRLTVRRILRHDPPHATPFCSQGLTTSSSGLPGLPEITPPRGYWRVTNDVLHRRQRTYHTDNTYARLTKDLSAFFAGKLPRIRQTIASSLRTARRSRSPVCRRTLDRCSTNLVSLRSMRHAR